jgi:hypothetical protein
VNLRLFAELGQQRALVSQYPWLRGTRVSLIVDNLFDSRLDVTNAAGETPIGYQPAYLDPLGRSVRITIASSSSKAAKSRASTASKAPEQAPWSRR